MDLKLELDHLVDRKLLQDIVDAASGESKLRVSVLHPKGEDFVGPRAATDWFCSKMVEAFPSCDQRCRDADRELGEELQRTKKPLIRPCWLGLHELAAPLIVRDQIIGMFMVGSLTSDDRAERESILKTVLGLGPGADRLKSDFEETVLALSRPEREAMLAFVTALAQVISGLAEARLTATEREQGLQRAADDAQRLLRLAAEVGKHEIVPQVIESAVKNAIEGMGADRGGITLYDETRDSLVIQSYQPKKIWQDSGVHEFSAAQDGSLSGLVFRTQRPFAHANLQMHRFAKPLASDSSGAAVAPLTGRNRLGVLWVESLEDDFFREEDAQRLHLFAAYSAVAIENARTLNERREFMELMTHQMVAPVAALERLCDRLAGAAESGGGLLLDGHNLARIARTVRSQAQLATRLGLEFANVFRLLREAREKIVLRLEPTRLATVVIGEVTLYRYLAQERRITIDVGEEGLDALPRVHTDRRLIGQLFSILLDNAVKYSVEGSEIRVVGQEPRRGWLQVGIFNRGLPINERERDKIFQDGYRTSAARAALPVGTGIGLTIAKRIVELHGGKIDVKSRPEGEAWGNWFEVQLPTATTARAQP